MLAAVYCRVSTEKDDQVNSLESQRDYFFNYIKKCPELALYQIYADRGISGTAAKNRTRFMQMMEDAEKGCFQIIITKEVSRFSRNILDAVSYSRKLKSLGVTIRFMNDGIDTSQPDAELRLSIMASLAQEESRKTSDRVKWGQTRRMEAGVVFGTSMLGYDVKDGKITVNKSGAQTVKLIFEKYVYCHLSALEITKELEKEGIKTYTNKEKWSASVIMKILKNEKYCGDLRQKKTYTPDYLTHKKKTNKDNEKTVYIKNHHIGIISRTLWEDAQKEIERRSRVKKESAGKGTKYPLSGKIICSECGSPFVSRKRKGKNGYYIVWKCSSKIRGNNCPVRYQIRDDNLLYMARYSFSLINIDKNKLIDKICFLIQQAKDKIECTSKMTYEQLATDIKSIEEKKLNAIDAYISGKISENDLEKLKLRYDGLISNYESKMNKFKKLKSRSKFTFIAIIKYIEKILYYKNIPYSIILSCIEKITAMENGIIKIKFLYMTYIFEFKTPYRENLN